MPETSLHRLRTFSFYLAGIALLCWVGWIGVHCWWHPILLVALAAGSLLIGSLIGFVFTSYSDEANTVGKVRDCIVSPLAGVTLLKFRSLKAVILVIAYTNNVNAFLDQSQQALAVVASLNWDIVSKVAYLQYYRAYFAKPEDKETQQQCAYYWILRALIINPQHIDFAGRGTFSPVVRHRDHGAE